MITSFFGLATSYMKKYLSLLRSIYFKVINSIAFYPSLIACCFLLFSIVIMSVEYMPAVMNFKEKIEFLLVADKDTAKSVLTTLVASLISLTVFSFSMVMVVLNTAASNLSPRVLPGLVSKKAHQIVLGFYLGSIIYCLVLVINVQKNEQSYQTPTLGVLLAMGFGILCMALFVYFIDSISRTIQVDNVMNQIFRQTRERMRNWQKKIKDVQPQLPEVEDWTYLKANKSGYYKDLAQRDLDKLLRKHDLKLYVRVTKGFFVAKGFPLLSVSRDIVDDAKLVEEILGHFTFFVEEYAREHHSYGFRQISEIAVKALSPGINDPGTAVRAVDMLSILFIEKIPLPDFDFEPADNDEEVVLFYREHSFEDLLFEMLTPIREYGRTDVLLMLNLIEACKNMLYASDISSSLKKIIARFIRSVKEDADKYITNRMDLQKINGALENLPQSIQKAYADAK